MKEFVLRKRFDLDEIGIYVYLELDVDIVVDKFIVKIDLGIK